MLFCVQKTVKYFILLIMDGENFKLPCVYCVFLAGLYEHKSTYTRKNYILSVEKHLYSQLNE